MSHIEAYWWGYEKYLLALGLVFLVRAMVDTYACLVFAWKCHLQNWIWPPDLKSMYGPWAAVTGATAGIGLGLVNYLANKGFNIVVISRNPVKLHNVATKLEQQYGVKTKVIVCEASDRASYMTVVKELEGIDIGIFVNNMATISEEGSRPLCFHETSPERVHHMNTINSGAATILTRFVLPEMMKRRRGVIVNMSSIAAIYPIPYQNHYSATKIYLETIMDAIRQEIRDYNIKIKNIRPFTVKSQMTATNNICYNNPFAQTPEQFANHFVPTLFSDLTTCGYWVTDIIMWTFRFHMEWVKRTGTYITMREAVKHGSLIDLNKLQHKY